MDKIYARLILRGVKSIEDVPKDIKDSVMLALEEIATKEGAVNE